MTPKPATHAVDRADRGDAAIRDNVGPHLRTELLNRDCRPQHGMGETATSPLAPVLRDWMSSSNVKPQRRIYETDESFT
jgi:hypothetical protein